MVVSRTPFLEGGAGVGATDDDDDALVSLHTCCEAISEARLVERGFFCPGHRVCERGRGTVQCCLPLFLAPSMS